MIFSRKLDNFVDGVFSTAGIPLVHLMVRPQYNVDKQRAFLQERVGLEPVITDSWAPIIVISCLVLLGVIMLSGALVYFVLSPKRAVKQTLKKQAKTDYKRSRGTIHRDQIKTALTPILKEKEQLNKSLAEAKNQFSQLKTQQNIELEKMVVAYLVQNQLTSIRGIGPQFAGRIQRQVFRDRLEDLHYSYRIQGVGPEKQHEIDRWIQQQKARLPTLINGNFPGKQEVTRRYDTKLASQQSAISRLETQIAQIDDFIQKPTAVYDQLAEVSEDDYYRVLLSGNGSAKLNDYEKGAFAEWENVPEWFIALMERENKRV